MILFALTVAASTVLTPAPQVRAWEIDWRANVWERGHPPLRAIPLLSFLNLAAPEAFFTRADCQRHGAKQKVQMVDFVSAWFSDADTDVWFRCRRIAP